MQHRGGYSLRQPETTAVPHRALDHVLQWIAIQLRELDAAIHDQEAELTSLRARKAQLLVEQAQLQQQRDHCPERPAASAVAQRAGRGRVAPSSGPRGSASAPPGSVRLG